MQQQDAAAAATTTCSFGGSFSQQKQQQPAGTSGFESIGGNVVHVPNPTYDYIPPELVSLFVTDTGGYTPSYVYRLLTEYYSREVSNNTRKEFVAGRTDLNFWCKSG